MTALVAQDGALAGQRFELEGDRTIGREGADITVDDDQMSRRHARLSVRDGAVAIEDLGSTNGTWVNGARIDAATTLSPGDTVRIGATTFRLEGAASPATDAAPVVATVPAAAPATPPPAPLATAAVGAPREPFGTYLAPESGHRGGGIASRQRGPILVTYAIVLGVAVALAVYFGVA